MNRFLDLHRVAQRDLEECAEFIRRDNPRSALRFLRAARTTMERLLAMPGMGSLYESDEAELAGIVNRSAQILNVEIDEDGTPRTHGARLMVTLLRCVKPSSIPSSEFSRPSPLSLKPPYGWPTT